MKQLKYDVVVIGSGIGGLTAGSLLCKAGYSTLVVERLPYTGGRCSSLDYRGYNLPTGAIIFTDEDQGAIVREVGGNFEMRSPDTLYTFRVEGKDYDAPPAGVLKTIIGQIKRDDMEEGRIMQAFRRAITWAEPSYNMTFEDWIMQSTNNPGILGMFNYLCAMVSGLPSKDVPAGDYFRMFKEMGGAKKSGYCPRWGEGVTGELAKAVKRLGGDIWTHSPALQIKVKNGRATGVIVRKYYEEIDIDAQVVISNAGPKRTVPLVGEQNLDPGYLKDVARVTGVPGIIIYFTSDRPLLETHSLLALTDTQRLFGISDYTHVNPECSPKGKYLLHGCAYYTSPEPPYDLKKEIDIALKEFKENLPGLEEYGELLAIKTYHSNWPWLGTRPGYSMPIKTPVENLYLSGDSSAPLGWWGSPAGITAGRNVVKDVMQRYKPA